MENGIDKNSPKSSHSHKKSKNTILRSKEFLERNSFLDDVMKNEHFLTIYRMVVLLVCGFIVYLVIYKYNYNGEINFGQHLVFKSFANFHRVAFLWICLYLSYYLVYYGFLHWATTRIAAVQNDLNVTRWDTKCLAIFIAYYLASFLFMTMIVLKQDLTIILTSVMGCEITRMLMKVYAFVRSNVPRVLKYKPHTDAQDEVLYPTLNQFTYFLWVPTLIYRDSYPRTKYIRWNYVITKILELVTTVFFISANVEYSAVSSYQDYGKLPSTWTDVLIKIFANSGYGALFVILGFYFVLDIWMNLFGELCRFGDRLFYQDWWTSTNFERYYRTWNILIHDWLYTYVYKDFYEIVLPGNKLAARYMVFFASAVFHEYLLYTSFGFVLPVMFLQFFFIGTSVIFINIKNAAIGNMWVLCSVALGNTINIAAFSIEYFARLNCPVDNPNVYSYLIPRLLSCGKE